MKPSSHRENPLAHAARLFQAAGAADGSILEHLPLPVLQDGQHGQEGASAKYKYVAKNQRSG